MPTTPTQGGRKTVELPDDLLKAVEEYKAKYRRPGLPELGWSSVYSLLPQKEYPKADQWPAEWPLSKQAGVYFILAGDGTLLYIGKASLNHCIGKRLSSYFGTDRRTGECDILDNWGTGPCSTPKYVAALAVPKDMSFEAAAIEEYLIGALDPPANTRGVRRSKS